MTWLYRLLLALFFSIVCLFLVHHAMPIIEVDFGWHLQFGKEAVEGVFPYLDTHTFSYFGQPWINHEWAGDILYWLLYRSFGFGSLVVLVAVAFVSAFFLLTYFFVRPKSVSQIIIGGLAIVLCLWSVTEYIYVTRLTFFIAPLFALLIIILETCHKKYMFPWLVPLVWLWSMLHGSWVIAGLVIGLYIVGNALMLLFPKLAWLGGKSGWSEKTLVRVIAWGGAAGVSTLINPYGFDLWKEVALYFVNSYYKVHILEWIPSFYFPVPLSALALSVAALVLLFIGFRARVATLTHLLVFCLVLVFAFLYRRNLMYLALLTAPVLARTGIHIYETMRARFTRFPHVSLRSITVGMLMLELLVIGIKIPKLYYLDDIWSNDRLLIANSYPASAIHAFRQKIGDAPVRVFNTFHWGGTLAWLFPEAQMYLDGRGTASWTSSHGNLLEHYQKILYEKNGIALLNELPADYVFLEKNFMIYTKVRRVDRLLLGTEKIETAIANQKEPELHGALRESDVFEVLYEDTEAVIYQRKKKATPSVSFFYTPQAQ